jgi:hypothetical protein
MGKRGDNKKPVPNQDDDDELPFVPVFPTDDVPENLQPWSTKPTTAANVSPGFYTKIHVCQASYGDCLALDIDPTPPEEPSGDALSLRLRVKKYQKDMIEVDFTTWENCTC